MKEEKRKNEKTEEREKRKKGEKREERTSVKEENPFRCWCERDRKDNWPSGKQYSLPYEREGRVAAQPVVSRGALALRLPPRTASFMPTFRLSIPN